MFGSKEIDTINNADIYGTYKDLYLSEREHEEKLLQSMQSESGLKAQVEAKKVDVAARTVTSQENMIKKTFYKGFAVPFFSSFMCILLD